MASPDIDKLAEQIQEQIQDQREINQIHDALTTEGLSSDETAVTLYAGLMGARQALAFWRKSPEELKITYKLADGFTPVSEADRRSELAMTLVVRKYYPLYSIYGEDTERITGLDPDNTSVQDGVDGSLTFIRGDYTWADAHSLCRRDPQTGEQFPITSTIVLPALGEVVVAEKGKGTVAYMLNRRTLEIEGEARRCSVSKPHKDPKRPPMHDIIISPDAIKIYETNTLEKNSYSALIDRMAGKTNTRAGGSNSHSGALVAMGLIDATFMDCKGGVFDALPSALSVEEAEGEGRYTDLNGNRLSIEKAEATEFTLGSNGPFHDTLLMLAQIAKPSFRDYRGWRTARIVDPQ